MKKNGKDTHIGEVLRAARLKEGISQTALAKSMGIHVSNLNRLESGARGFDDDWLPLLPVAIRTAVGRVLERECRTRLAKLQRLRKNQFVRRGATQT